LKISPGFYWNFSIFTLIFALFPEKWRTYPQAGRNDLPARAHISRFVLVNSVYSRWVFLDNPR
jgi:hypothetical protein